MVISCRMAHLLSPEAGLAGLFLVSLLAATLLPGGSEAAFLGFLLAFPEKTAAALACASLGNTAGSLLTYALGRLLPPRLTPQKAALAARWGAPILFFAWLPFVGDALCLAAGWLRLPWLACGCWIALGKTVRYAALAYGALALG